MVDHQLPGHRLDHPRAAVGPSARGVGVDGLARSRGGADAVGAREDRRGQEQSAAPGAREGADGLQEVSLAGQERALVINREGHGGPVFAGVLAAQQVLTPVFGPLHRPAQPAGRERDCDLLGVEKHLLAERPAYVRHDHPDLRFGKAKGAGEQTPGQIGPLRGQPDGQLPSGRVPAGENATRLHGNACVAMLPERLGEDVRRGREHRLHGRVLHRRQLEQHVGCQLGMDQRHATVRGVLRVHHGRYRVNLYLQQVDRVLGGVA